jgi:hypothetical protein
MSKNESSLCIDNQRFSYELDISEFGGLCAVSITNKITGDHFDLGRADELRLWIDTAISRMELKTWQQVTTGPSDTDPDDDPGFKSGHFQCEVDDEQWERFIIPLGSRDRYTWARTSFALPESAGHPVTIVLGGYGLHDSDWMRVFLNGTEMLLRVETARWREPAVLRFDPEDPDYELLCFGGDNVLAMQTKGYRATTALLRTYPDCFRNSRFILGNPWKDNLYGYLCANADRAFIALNNGGPTDAEAELKLTAEWGFTEDSRWRIFQRWPRSERHFPSEGEEVASGTVSLKMEPWDIVLHEIVLCPRVLAT